MFLFRSSLTGIFLLLKAPSSYCRVLGATTFLTWSCLHFRREQAVHLLDWCPTFWLTSGSELFFVKYGVSICCLLLSAVGELSVTFKGVSFRGFLRPDNFEATGLSQGPSLGTTVKSCMEKKKIWFPPSSAGGSRGSNELSSIITSLTMAEWRKQGTSHGKTFPLVFCFGKEQPAASEVIVKLPYLLITNEHICMNSSACFSSQFISHLVASTTLLSPLSPILSDNVPNFDQNGIHWPLNLSLLSSVQLVGCTCPLNEVKMTTRDSYSEVTELW